jgi:glyoxylase-like metal-dependent hydrolase (beta-lactamase superfamily II)
MDRPGSISLKHFGDVEVAVVSAGILRDWVPSFEPGQKWITPDTDVDAAGAAIGGLNWMFVRSKHVVLLVDPATFEPGELIGRATLVAGLDLDSALGQLAVTPGEVTLVVISHFHPDHVCGLVAHDSMEPRFPNAVHVVPARDWESYVVRDERGIAGELMRQLGPVRDAGLLREVAGDEMLANGISVIDTPGESPGHLSVRVQTPAGAVYYIADLVHFPAEFEHIDWIAVRDRPADELIASRRRIFHDADRTATFVYTHSRFPAWGKIQPTGPDAWRWRYLDDATTPA